ncbi:Uncharacterized protein PBTT_04012 [Plasmodiophora brassicae]
MQAQDILDADNEAQARKRHRLAHPAQITGDECAASMVRSHAIIAEHAAQAYAGVGAAPAWFAPALQAQLQPQLQALQAQLQPLQAQLQLLSARTDNLRIRSRNVHRITIQEHLSPVSKEVADHPAGAIPAVFAGLVPSGGAFAVGTILPELPFFPAAGVTSSDIHGLTGAQVGALQWFYNVHFAPPGAALSVRRDGLQEFLLM